MKSPNAILLENLNISLKQWHFRLHWQKTKAQKAGLWHKIRKTQQTMDLDLSCILYDNKGEVLESVWFKNVRDKAEAIRYQGDELIGDRPLHKDKNTLSEKIEPKYENIALYPPLLSPEVAYVVFVLSSYTGHDLNLVKQGDCSLIDDEGNDILNISLPKLANAPAIWLATLTRYENQWYFEEKLQNLTQYRQDGFVVEIMNDLKNT